MKCRLHSTALVLLIAALPASAGQVTTASVNDRAYGHERRLFIYKSAPDIGTKSGQYDLFVFLGGEEYLTDLALPATLDALGSSGKIGPTVAVAVEITERPAEIANRAKFADFVAKDLMPALRKQLGHLPDTKRVTVGGWSFGGVTASYLAFRHPELFGNVLSQSGAYWRGNEGASEPAEWLTAQFREKPRLPIRFYLEVGSEETITTPSGVVFIEANRHLHDVLEAKGYVVKYVEVPGGRHHPTSWRTALPAAIAYLATK